MSIIDINLVEVGSINTQLPYCLMRLSSIRRELEIMKWKLDEELMCNGNMKERYSYILRQISDTEEKINDIHNFISSATRQYEEIERRMNEEVSEFL